MQPELRGVCPGFTGYLTDSVIKRLEERGLVERMEDRGAWRLVVT